MSTMIISKQKGTRTEARATVKFISSFLTTLFALISSYETLWRLSPEDPDVFNIPTPSHLLRQQLHLTLIRPKYTHRSTAIESKTRDPVAPPAERLALKLGGRTTRNR